MMQTVKIEPFHIIGIAVKTTNEHGKAEKEIAALWVKFMKHGTLQKIPNKVDSTIYSVYTDYEGDYSRPYTALLGCKVRNLDEVPAEMTGKTFAGGKYVKITAKGNLANGLIVNQWKKIWQMDLERRYTADFEVFGEKAQNPGDAEVDFLVSVK